MARKSRSIITLFVRSIQKNDSCVGVSGRAEGISAHILDGCVKFNSWALQGQLSKTVCFQRLTGFRS